MQKLCERKDALSRYTPDELRDFDIDSLSVGEGLRLHHSECSEGHYDKTLSITRHPEGLMYHCYRCGVKGFISTSLDPYSAARYLKRRQMKQKAQDPDIVELPWDFVPMVQKPNRIPPKAYAWLYQYELDDADLCDYNIGFSNKLQRVIMPIYRGYNLIGWIGRDIHYKKGYKGQKYHNEFQGGGRVYFVADSDNTIVDASSDSKSLVFVEDILSAIKCRKATGHVAIALLNTSVGDSTIRHLMEGHINYLWLDDDARIKALRQVFKYKQQGINITSVRTHVDPKQVSLQEIPGYIKG